MPLLNAPKESVLPTLRSVERRLLKDPIKAEVYKEEMRKLLETGAVREVVGSIPESPECWYIPHHIVSHNGKFCIVFNCSHQYQGQSLNQYLLPGPTLSASLLGVLIRFREHPVAVSGDIKAMFHQVRLLPEDRPLLRFLWRDLKMDEVPKILEWQELLDVTALELRAGLAPGTPPEAEDYHQAEVHILKRVQQESFPEDYKLLRMGKSVSPRNRLVILAPEMDLSSGLIRVGGRLRRVAGIEDSVLHPVVLDPNHPVTRLIIHYYDHQLHHSGSERLFAEIRRYYWILRGRKAVHRFQHDCLECQRWRAQPTIPKMADLPSARLRLHKPAFHSCGVDCFGPMLVKIGRQTEKRWGILFKCLTTRAVHLDLLSSMSTDSFLMALRRFVARRGTPAELWSDQGTNFRGGERELREAYAALIPNLQHQLTRQKIHFHFNPPSAPHCGGVWERERSSGEISGKVFGETSEESPSGEIWSVTLSISRTAALTPTRLCVSAELINTPPTASV
ncbi:hypothetical protein QTP86_013150 [Hemibagrus guttatus]|nr:hypothetical protein QTP86_013150 [Hemibagrus guttatus]